MIESIPIKNANYCAVPKPFFRGVLALNRNDMCCMALQVTCIEICDDARFRLTFGAVWWHSYQEWHELRFWLNYFY